MKDELKAKFQTIADEGNTFSVIENVPEVPEVPATEAIPAIPAHSETVDFQPTVPSV